MTASEKPYLKKIGQPPGTLIYTGTDRDIPIAITLIRYNEHEFSEKKYHDIDEISIHTEEDTVSWIDINALHNTNLLEKIGEKFRLHPLIIEDILHTEHLPKFEDFEHYLFFTLKMITLDSAKGRIVKEHVSFILGDNYLLSFQEKPGDLFEPIRERIRACKGKIRKKGVDYLLYALIDTITDHYYFITNDIDKQILGLEDEIIHKPSDASLKRIIRLKKKLISLRKAMYPLRNALQTLQKEQTLLISDNTRMYLGDVSDHVENVITSMEAQRETLTEYMNLYASQVSNKMNTVMKRLTGISAIFIPLTFIVGVYGMNFKFMPELKSPWGYPIVIISMFFLTVAMVIYMKKKDWF